MFVKVAVMSCGKPGDMKKESGLEAQPIPAGTELQLTVTFPLNWLTACAVTLNCGAGAPCTIIAEAGEGALNVKSLTCNRTVFLCENGTLGGVNGLSVPAISNV